VQTKQVKSNNPRAFLYHVIFRSKHVEQLFHYYLLVNSQRALEEELDELREDAIYLRPILVACDGEQEPWAPGLFIDRTRARD